MKKNYSNSRIRRIRATQILESLMDGAFYEQPDDDPFLDELPRALTLAYQNNCGPELETLVDALTKKGNPDDNPSSTPDLATILASIRGGNRQHPRLPASRIKLSRAGRKAARISETNDGSKFVIGDGNDRVVNR